MRSVRVAGVALAVSLVACSSPVATPSDDATSTASAQPVAPAPCPNIPLRYPDGKPVSLTGTWIGTGGIIEGVYYLYQSGSCVWWSGGYATSSTTEGRNYDGLGWVTYVFVGQLGNDFVLSRTWVAVRIGGEGGGQHRGTATYRVDVSDPQAPVLQRTELIGERGLPPPMTLTRWSEQTVPPP